MLFTCISWVWWNPVPNYNVMHGWFGALRRHIKPQRGKYSQWRITFRHYEVRVSKNVDKFAIVHDAKFSKIPVEQSIVVVKWYLDSATTKVAVLQMDEVSNYFNRCEFWKIRRKRSPLSQKGLFKF